MKSFFLMALLMMTTMLSIAQRPGGGGGRGMGGQAMNIGHFYGKIVDDKTNKGIEAASVQLMSTKFDSVSKKRVDTILGGMLT
ncbi:MAG TPA: hypothetical protein VK625_08235, partial [Flavitalea sp.]|nr:hypothetical protein [Flavitalea sp.]